MEWIVVESVAFPFSLQEIIGTSEVQERKRKMASKEGTIRTKTEVLVGARVPNGELPLLLGLQAAQALQR